MPLVKKLSKLCKRCGKLYPSNCKTNGICDDCKLPHGLSRTRYINRKVYKL